MHFLGVGDCDPGTKLNYVRYTNGLNQGLGRHGGKNAIAIGCMG